MTSITDYEVGIGRTLRPGIDYAFFNEGFDIGRINDFGYLGPSYPPEKENHIYRIALLGDSYIEGYQLFDRYHIRFLLEDQLNAFSTTNQVEVMNFGRSGFNLENMYIYYERFVKKFKPDLVLWFISNEDFIAHNKDPLLLRTKCMGDSILIDDCSIKDTDIRYFNKLKFYVQNFAVLQMVNNSRKLIKNGMLFSKLFGKFARNDGSKSNSTEIELIPYAQLISNIAKTNKNRTILINRANTELDEKYVSTILSEGIELINLSDTLHSKKEGEQIYNYWVATNKNGHWNHLGHKTISEFLIKRLKLVVD